MEMLNHDGPVIFDCLVEKHENCFPMIPSGKAHNEMLLGECRNQGVIDAKGRCWCKSPENVRILEEFRMQDERYGNMSALKLKKGPPATRL